MDDNVDDYIETTTSNTDTGVIHFLRRSWFEILLIIAVLYFLSQYLMPLGSRLLQLAVFALPFLGLWIFAKVNQHNLSRKMSSGVEIKHQIAKNQDWHCAKCNHLLHAGNWEIAYIIPVYKAGSTNTIDNLEALCTKCHRDKILNESFHATLRDAL
jgi:hypothetical protein